MDLAGTLGERRGELAITIEILRLAKRGEGRTRIMYAANMSHAMLRRYLDGLERLGFIARSGQAYTLTARGQALLTDMERVATHFEPQRAEAYSPDARPRSVV
jgi:predicted transcriptional regulator